MSLLLAGAVIGAIGQIYSGVSSMNAANQTAADMREQGSIIFNESMRTAAIIEEEGYKFGAMQSLQYIGSGVQVAGSALVTIAQTTKYAKTEAEAVRARGAAKRDLAYSGAQRTENQGRAQLVSGIIGGASSMFSAAGGRTVGGVTPPISSRSNYNAPDYYYPGYNTPGSTAWYLGLSRGE